MAALGRSGRTVRCSRCKEVWVARPEDAAVPEMAYGVQSDGRDDPATEWDALDGEGGGQQTPLVDSPPIAGDWQDDDSSQVDGWAARTREEELHPGDGRARKNWLRIFGRPSLRAVLPRKPSLDLRFACAAMGALVAALIVWRADVVKLLPQTANFYRMAGMEVNLRGLSFKDVKVASETVEGKPVLVIEGTIVSETNKAAEMPRLRFSVRDEQGAEIYAWNAVLEKAVLKPGERAPFKSRLASPPAEGRSIDIRFFNKHDIASGSA
jgi:hypothetical protein